MDGVNEWALDKNMTILQLHGPELPLVIQRNGFARTLISARDSEYDGGRQSVQGVAPATVFKDFGGWH